MRRVRARLAAAACAAAFLSAAGARAAGAPAPEAGDGPRGYVGRGQIVIRTVLGASSTLTVGGDIALEERGFRLRVDVLSLGIPGTNATTSALVGAELFPAGGFTVVYAGAGVPNYTIWSSARRTYYTSVTAGSAAKPPATLPPSAAALDSGDFFTPFAIARSLKDVSALRMSISLAGHASVNGHPTSGLDYDFARTRTAGGDAVDVHGRLDLAEDLDGVPVRITASAKGKTFPESAVQLDLTTLVRQTPPLTDFEVPPGFTRAATPGDVLGRNLPV